MRQELENMRDSFHKEVDEIGDRSLQLLLFVK